MSADAFELRRLFASLIPRRLRRGRFAEAPFLGYIDRLTRRADTLVLRGWLVSRGTPITELCLRARDQELSVPFGLDRVDVARALPVEPGAAYAGFALDALLPRDVDGIELWATLRGGQRVLAFRSSLDVMRTPGAAAAAIRPAPERRYAANGGPAVKPLLPTGVSLDVLLARHRPRVIVELDAPARETPIVAAAQRVAPEAVVYLVGAGLGAPDHEERVCVLDATAAAALTHFTDGTVDLVLAHDEVPGGWQMKLRSGGAIVLAGCGKEEPKGFLQGAPR